MRLVILTRYGRQGASSRVRFLQYLPWLEAAGFVVDTSGMLDDRYLAALYSGGNVARPVLTAYQQRFADLMALRSKADLVWLEKEAMPWVPYCIEAGLIPAGLPLVTDYDDAVYHRYDMHRRWTVRSLFGRKHARLMKRSAVIFAGNCYLADYGKSAGGVVEIVPSVVDLVRYRLREEDGNGKLSVGWIGTPSTWAECVSPFLEPILQTVTDGGAVFEVVGARPVPGLEGAIRFLPWTETEEVKRIQAMDIGIMPLPDTPWMRGKCGYKLIQYMACGLPVVASPVGVNTEIVEHGVNGFLAQTPEEWTEALTTLLRDPELRRRMGQAGRKRVEERYSLAVQGPRVAALLKDIVEARQKSSLGRIN